MCWTGLDVTRTVTVAGDCDTWEPLDNLTNCEAFIATFKLATGCSLPRLSRRRRRSPATAAGFTVDAPARAHSDLAAIMMRRWHG